MNVKALVVVTSSLHHPLVDQVKVPAAIEGAFFHIDYPDQVLKSNYPLILHVKLADKSFLFQKVTIKLMLNLFLPVFVADDVVVDKVFEDKVVGSIGVERVVFLEID